MIINKEILAKKLKDNLNHLITNEELVDWAENAMMNGEFEKADHDILRDIVAHIGVSDVKTFGLNAGDYEKYLEQLGFKLEYVITEIH